jgi:uncharacterized protein
MAMGLLNEGINEVIATTHHNAAPMGIIKRNEKLRMVLYHGSHTANQIASDGWVVANFIFDPVLYVTTAFEDLPAGAFIAEKAGEFSVERLCSCEAWGAYKAKVERNTRQSLLISLMPVREEIGNLTLHPVNRGFNSIIEATVHGTRYKMTRDKGLLDLIEYHAGIVKKCGGPRESDALSLLFDYIEYP